MKTDDNQLNYFSEQIKLLQFSMSDNTLFVACVYYWLYTSCILINNNYAY